MESLDVFWAVVDQDDLSILNFLNKLCRSIKWKKYKNVKFYKYEKNYNKKIQWRIKKKYTKKNKEELKMK